MGCFSSRTNSTPVEPFSRRSSPSVDGELLNTRKAWINTFNETRCEKKDQHERERFHVNSARTLTASGLFLSRMNTTEVNDLKNKRAFLCGSMGCNCTGSCVLMWLIVLPVSIILFALANDEQYEEDSEVFKAIVVILAVIFTLFVLLSCFYRRIVYSCSCYGAKKNSPKLKNFMFEVYQSRCCPFIIIVHRLLCGLKKTDSNNVSYDAESMDSIEA